MDYQSSQLNARFPGRRRSAPFMVTGLAATALLSSPALAATTAEIEPRILAQEGLAIALASNVLQSQIQILVAASGTPGQCTALAGGGSVQLNSQQISGKVVNAQVDVYFDSKCQKPYVEAAVVATMMATGITATETATYLGLKGQLLGTLTLTESLHGTKVVLGVGKFAPANGSQTVDLGLTCSFLTSKTASCEGGIAQTFPKLGASLASVTPLTLTLGKGHSVTFSGSTPAIETGVPGALSITTPTNRTLGIGGTGSNYGTAVTAGFASKFALFPPTPTYWAITDTGHDAKFSLTVVSNTTRNSTATVTAISTGASLAALAVDRTGTGKISYFDGTKSTITGWLLAD